MPPKMVLSVVVVSYNVKFFLEQCLSSLSGCIATSPVLNKNTEVFIVDNHSDDNTVEFLEPLFPAFHFIKNQNNTGFSKANNQGFSLCSGEYILILNPDTIVGEDSLDHCISFLKNTPGAGAAGVHMINGKGRFLKESKRGFPSPATAFYKMSGLTSLFPNSKIFARYYLGHLSESETNTVDVLSGAFMMVKKKVLDITGGFDELFFMYGEDIDLSYRIQQAGFSNFYLADTTIIHFKGESTRRDIKYVKLFYSAMKLFIRKHFHGKLSFLSLYFISLGLKLHQVLAFLTLPFKSRQRQESRPPTFILGSPEQVALWNSVLKKKNILPVDNKNLAEQILYCQSENTSWKTIIADMQYNKDVFLYKFYGAGTHAAVGSTTIHGRDEFLAL